MLVSCTMISGQNTVELFRQQPNRTHVERQQDYFAIDPSHEARPRDRSHSAVCGSAGRYPRYFGVSRYSTLLTIPTTKSSQTFLCQLNVKLQNTSLKLYFSTWHIVVIGRHRFYYRSRSSLLIFLDNNNNLVPTRPKC